MGTVSSCFKCTKKRNNSSSSQPGLKPMLMPEILDIVFENCSHHTWKTARLVCKTWYYTLLPRWRAEKYLSIRHYFDSRACSHQPEEEIPFIGYISINQYFAIHHSSKKKNIYTLQQIPYQCIRINFDTMHIERPELIQFFELCGPSLKRLIVELPQSHLTQTLRKILFQFTPKLEHLEYYGDAFRLENHKSDEPTDIGHYTKSSCIQPNMKSIIISRAYFNHLPFPINKMELLSAFPNLKKLHLLGILYNATQPPTDDLDKFVDVMDAIRMAEGNKFLNLEEFCFNIYPDFNDPYGLLDTSNKIISEDAVTKLSGLKLPLVKLTGNVQGMTNQDLITLIKPYHQTLKELTLFSLGKCNTFTSCEGILPDLTTLNLHGSIFTNWTFLHFTPNLKTLVVNQWCTLSNDCIFPILHKDLYQHFLGRRGTPRLECVRPLVHLKTFVYLTMEPVPLEGIRWLAIRMPNLHKAMITTDQIGGSALFWQWSHLKQVMLQMSTTGESSVTMKSLVIMSQTTEQKYAVEQFSQDMMHMNAMFPRDFGEKPKYYLPKELNEAYNFTSF